MPTPAKLVCAVLFAAVAWYSADTIVRLRLPEEASVGRFREIVMLGGLLIGWRYIGGVTTGKMRRGTTVSVGLTAGIGGAAVLLVLGLFLEAFRKMIVESLDRAYGEVGEAVSGWVEFLVADVAIVLDPVVLGTLFAGGAVTGLVGWAVGRTTT